MVLNPKGYTREGYVPLLYVFMSLELLALHCGLSLCGEPYIFDRDGGGAGIVIVSAGK